MNDLLTTMQRIEANYPKRRSLLLRIDITDEVITDKSLRLGLCQKKLMLNFL